MDFFRYVTMESTLNDDFWIQLSQLKTQLNEGYIDLFLPMRETNEIRSFLIVLIKQLLRKLIDMPLFTNGSIQPNSLSIVNRKSWLNVDYNENDGVFMVSEPRIFIKIKPKKQNRFLCLLTKILDLLVENKFSTKRHIFYEERELFHKQSTLDELIDDVCCILGANRFQLHIFPSSKGLIYGNVALFCNDETIMCNQLRHGINIPVNVSDITSIASTAKFLLVVEKDTTFQRLLNSKICDLPVILLTGKGFPDTNTRQMVKLLWKFLRIPIFALVDADPFGIEIMCVYKYGSLQMAYENESCVTTQIKWLGIHPSDIKKFAISENSLEDLTPNDHSKIDSLLERPYVRENQHLQHQLAVLRNGNKKAEIECFNDLGYDYLKEVFIPGKIKYGGWL